ncbi:MAG: Hpt domain-containing protein [Spirochaetales bacterium]|nr:Hpt domain-containing protein [Spirochaetales bacterium]
MQYKELLNRHNPPDKKSWPINYEVFQRFFWKFRGLQKEQSRNDAFWGATNENLKFAYEKLDEQEREIERAYNLNKLYLDNIREGLLIVDKSFTILDQYSRFLTILFKTRRIKGRNFIDFLFPDVKGQAEDRKEFTKFLSILFKSTAAEMDMLEEINPLREKILKVKSDKGQVSEIVISVNFSRIMRGEEIEHVIFIIEDLTDMTKMQKELEFEKNRYLAENESISAILRIGPKAFLDFLDESTRVIDDFEENIHMLSQPSTLHRLFRESHSLKGSAKYMELNHVADTAHRIEDHLSKIINRKMNADASCISNLSDLLNNLYMEFKNIAGLIDKFKAFSSITRNAKQVLNNSGTENFFKSLKRMAENIANELGKSVNFKITNQAGDIPFLEKIRNPLIHLVRNALDHGIEDAFERVAKKKNPIATIELKITKDGNQYNIEVTDDGHGIDFSRIRKKAAEKHYFNSPNDTLITDGKLLNLIFSPNFSSRDMVTELSGRGFGLDVVRDAVKALKGKISVSTVPSKGTKFSLKIPR